LLSSSSITCSAIVGHLVAESFEQSYGYLNADSQQMVRSPLAEVGRGSFTARGRLFCLVDDPGPFDWASVRTWEPEFRIHDKIGNLATELAS